MINDVAEYNRREFIWYCHTFFNFGAHLDTESLTYLASCFDHVTDSARHTESISSKSFVHRISGTNIDSSGIAYGFKTLNPITRAMVLECMQRIIPCINPTIPIASCTGAGIAWNVQTDTTRAYFYHTSPPPWIPEPSLAMTLRPLCHPEWIIGLTARKGQIIEQKWYVYPTTSTWQSLIDTYAEQDKELQQHIAQSSIRLALVISNTKTPKFQFDIHPTSQYHIVETLQNPGLQRIFDTSRLYGQDLDTISLHDGIITAYFD